jgi:hypothetical protein
MFLVTTDRPFWSRRPRRHPRRGGAKPDPLDEHEEFRRLSIEGTLEHFDRYVARDR